MASDGFLRGQCPQCAEPFRLPSSAAGRRARCRACDAVFAVDDALRRLTDDGAGQVVCHQARERDFEWAPGDSETIEAVSAHITRHVGPIHSVFHEVFSDLVHVDIHWVRPTQRRPFHTLVTSGMSDRPMAAPPGAEACTHAEVLVTLPADWRLTEADFNEERWYWPLRWLKILARLPHEFDTWLWDLHTVPNGDPPAPFADGTAFCCMMLVKPVSLPEEFWTLAIGDKTIHFFALLPLYREEVDHKLKHGGESLLPRFEKAGISDIVDPTRKNVCARRLGLW